MAAGVTLHGLIVNDELIAPSAGPRDAHGIGRHLPALCALALDAYRHFGPYCRLGDVPVIGTKNPDGFAAIIFVNFKP